MAQIKTLKINSDGFTEEHGASDDVTFATVTGSTQLAVTGGTTITNNITFNAVTDTIAGIQNQNLLDKTASETITGTWTIDAGSKLILTDAPTLGSHAVNKSYVDNLVNGISWQDPVINTIDFTTAEPATPAIGDRYINTTAGNTSITSQAVAADSILEWNGTNWTEITPSEGWAVYDETDSGYYVYNGGNWVFFGSVVNHNNLSGLQGGTTNEYYHMTAAEDTYLAAAVTKTVTGGAIVANNVNDTLSATYTVTGELDVAGGDLVLPNSTQAVPEEGSVYWDGTADKLYVYNGTAYVDVGASGSSSAVVSTYTAGAGGIAAKDVVYISANNTILKGDANSFASSKIIGFAPSAISAGNSGEVQESGVLVGVLSGATAGDAYFLGETAGTISTARPTTSGAFVTLVGYAKNATDLHIQIQQIGRRA